MSTAVVYSEISRQLSELWKSDNDVNTQKIQQQYMKIFAEVWGESIEIFNRDAAKQDSLETEKEVQNVVTEATENMEELEVRHEATLITVTKKRKEYPARIAAYLGKKRRLQKNTFEVLNVDLPPRSPLEIEHKSCQMTKEASLERCSSNFFSESMLCLQPYIQRVSNLADAVNTLTSIHDDPAEIICNSKSL